MSRWPVQGFVVLVGISLVGMEGAVMVHGAGRVPQESFGAEKEDWGMHAMSRPLVGREGPGFEAIAVVDQDFQSLRLADYRGRYVILFFYPLDFTFVCPTEVAAFSDRYDEFQSLDTDILGISVDSQYAHLAWIQTERKLGGVGAIRYPLVSDLTKAITASYGVLDAQEGVALRGLFILDPEGVVQHATVNNLAFGRSVDDTLRSLRAVQHVQRYRGEVCPVDWQPGDGTLTEEVGQVQAYFSRATQAEKVVGSDGAALSGGKFG